MSKRTILIVIIVILVLAIAGVGIWLYRDKIRPKAAGLYGTFNINASKPSGLPAGAAPCLVTSYQRYDTSGFTDKKAYEWNRVLDYATLGIDVEASAYLVVNDKDNPLIASGNRKKQQLSYTSPSRTIDVPLNGKNAPVTVKLVYSGKKITKAKIIISKKVQDPCAQGGLSEFKVTWDIIGDNGTFRLPIQTYKDKQIKLDSFSFIDEHGIEKAFPFDDIIICGPGCMYVPKQESTGSINVMTFNIFNSKGSDNIQDFSYTVSQ
jgi:hypothetical protein